MLVGCVCRAVMFSLISVAVAALAGCTVTGSAPYSGVDAGLNCVDDSADCLNKRRLALAAIMSDKEATWVDRAPSANFDASGVRLFAFKMRKRELNCRQLRVGYDEAKGARARLRASPNPELTPALISRGAILGDEVARELNRELSRRKCGPKAY